MERQHEGLQSKSTGHDPLVIALIVLTFSTGLIDAASYIGSVEYSLQT